MNNSNQSAFPLAASHGEYNDVIVPFADGLTKREYFAAKAMQGILSNRELINGYTSSSAKDVATFAIECADAILAELDKPTA